MIRTLISRKKQKTHITVLVECEKEEYEEIEKEIRKMVRKHNHFSEKKMSFTIVEIMNEENQKENCQGQNTFSRTFSYRK